jgi:predicted metal-dependent HD superfamily phosphohydrolase
MTDIFERSFERCGFDNPHLRSFLMASYREEHRFYHDLSHIADLLYKIERLPVEWAWATTDLMTVAWFHDSEYGCRPGIDEEESATNLQFWLGPLHESDHRQQAILDTAGHDDPYDEMSAMFCDLDLSRIGNPNYDDFILDGEKLRAEYRHVSDVDWLKGRGSFLAKLRDRPRIFHTKYGREMWERNARSNIDSAVSYYVARLAEL